MDRPLLQLEQFKTRNGKHSKYQVKANDFVLGTFDTENSAKIYLNGVSEIIAQETKKAEVSGGIKELKKLTKQDRYTNRDSYAQTRIAELQAQGESK